MQNNFIIHGNSLNILAKIPNESVQCIITSPPYWSLRNYNTQGQIGLEDTIDCYIEKLLLIFKDLHRILAPDGTVWLNLGDVYTSGNRSYRARDKKNINRELSKRPKTPNGLKPKDLIGLPWRIALRLQEEGWYLRNDIIWHKPNAMPESVKDRPYRNHEYLFLLSKNKNYFFDHTGLVSNSTKLRSVWKIPSNSYKSNHSATFPKELIVPCIQASTKECQFILDPFFGSGTVGVVCEKLKRNFVAIELNRDYINEALKRINKNYTFFDEDSLKKIDTLKLN